MHRLADSIWFYLQRCKSRVTPWLRSRYPEFDCLSCKWSELGSSVPKARLKQLKQPVLLHNIFVMQLEASTNFYILVTCNKSIYQSNFNTLEIFSKWLVFLKVQSPHPFRKISPMELSLVLQMYYDTFRDYGHWFGIVRHQFKSSFDLIWESCFYCWALTWCLCLPSLYAVPTHIKTEMHHYGDE